MSSLLWKVLSNARKLDSGALYLNVETISLLVKHATGTTNVKHEFRIYQKHYLYNKPWICVAVYVKVTLWGMPHTKLYHSPKQVYIYIYIYISNNNKKKIINQIKYKIIA